LSIDYTLCGARSDLPQLHDIPESNTATFEVAELWLEIVHLGVYLRPQTVHECFSALTQEPWLKRFIPLTKILVMEPGTHSRLPQGIGN